MQKVIYTTALSAYIMALESKETAGKGRKPCFQAKNGH
jgi:hypothetical protein